MKALKITSLLVVILMLTTQCVAQRTYTVKAENNDVSNNLDLKAVATVFGESKNLEEFEQKLNDYDSNISNLDLNNDGQVDYLRVVEDLQNNTHVVVIQAVLDTDVYQDVATIVVDKDQYNSATVQIIGDPYIYGPNYIIEPAYYYTPSIFDSFWGMGYHRWHSPYYWGYYPGHFHYRHPFEVDIYMSNVYGYVNHNHRYYYSNRIRNAEVLNIRSSISRNDFAVRHPESSFSSRNVEVRNKRDFEFNRNGSIRSGGGIRPSSNSNTYENKVNRNSVNTTNSGYNRSSGNTSVQQNQTNSGLRRDNNNTYQNRTNPPTNNTFTSPTNNNNRINQPTPRTENSNPNNQIHRDIPTRPNTPVVQPRATTVQPTPRPVVKESQRDTRENSSREGERK